MVRQFLAIVALVGVVVCSHKPVHAGEPGPDDEPIKTELRVYDIGVLLSPNHHFADVRGFSVRSDVSKTIDGLFVIDSELVESVSPKWEQDIVADHIRQHVAPDCWRINGGLNASMNIWRDRLFVTASAKTHAEVEKLLAEMKRIEAKRVTLEVTAVVAPSAVVEGWRTEWVGEDLRVSEERLAKARAALLKTENVRPIGVSRLQAREGRIVVIATRDERQPERVQAVDVEKDPRPKRNSDGERVEQKPEPRKIAVVEPDDAVGLAGWVVVKTQENGQVYASVRLEAAVPVGEGRRRATTVIYTNVRFAEGAAVMLSQPLMADEPGREVVLLVTAKPIPVPPKK